MNELNTNELTTIAKCSALVTDAKRKGNNALAKAALERKYEISISHIRTQEQCVNFIKNVTKRQREDLVPLILQRSLELSIQDYANESPLEDVEIACLKVLFLYEKQLALKNGRANKATYTRRSIKNNGIVKAVDNIVSKNAETVGFKNLCSVGLTLDSFEVVVDKFPEKFSSLAVEKSRQRLNLAA